MTAILKNIQMAWLGWKNYTNDGKLVALLLASLLFLWYDIFIPWYDIFIPQYDVRKKVGKPSFFGYTIVITICCIFPVTAGLLMVYQTQFYDYEWIWSLVPVTAAIAYGATFFLGECWNSSAESKGDLPYQDGFKMTQWRRGIPMTMLLLAIIVLSGGLGRPSWDRKGQAAEREKAYVILDQIMALSSEGEICLWAPREIMAYAREHDGRIRLPYGRNMWDISLNAYAYDTYDEQTKALYQWMEQAGKADTIDAADAIDIMDNVDAMDAIDTVDAIDTDTIGTNTVSVSLEACIQYAQDAGVDCVVLPEAVSQETIQRIETALHTKARLLEGYWIFYERAD